MPQPKHLKLLGSLRKPRFEKNIAETEQFAQAEALNSQGDSQLVSEGEHSKTKTQ